MGLAPGAVPELRCGVLCGLGDGNGLHRGAVSTDLGPDVAKLGGVEPHCDDCVAAAGLCLADEPAHRLVAALGQVLRDALQLAAEHRLEAGAHLGEGVTRSDGPPEHLPAAALDI